jgi:hypothetical protein
MIDATESSQSRGRLVFGCVLLVISIIPWVVAPLTPLLGLPAAQLARVVAALLIGAEIIGAVAIVVLGKEAYTRIKRRLWPSNNRAPNSSQPSAERAPEREAHHE